MITRTVSKKTAAKEKEKRAALESLPPMASMDRDITDTSVPPTAWPEDVWKIWNILNSAPHTLWQRAHVSLWKSANEWSESALEYWVVHVEDESEGEGDVVEEVLPLVSVDLGEDQGGDEEENVEADAAVDSWGYAAIYKNLHLDVNETLYMKCTLACDQSRR